VNLPDEVLRKLYYENALRDSRIDPAPFRGRGSAKALARERR
jgi:hypothetical protein